MTFYPQKSLYKTKSGVRHYEHVYNTNQIKSTRKATVAFYGGQIALPLPRAALVAAPPPSPSCRPQGCGRPPLPLAFLC